MQDRILIVDDETNILNTLKRLLSAEDMDIHIADTVAGGLEKLKSIGGIDLVISDNRLPDMAGIDFLVKVRQSYPDTIRILMTGYPDLESTIQAINKGQVYRFIPKPWENEELVLTVRQALEYYDILRDNKVLIKIAKQQAEWLNTLKKRYPQVSEKDFDKNSMYIIEEGKVSENLSEFMKKYYPKD